MRFLPTISWKISRIYVHFVHRCQEPQLTYNELGPALLHQLYQMLSIRGRSRPKLRIRGDEVPTVDVFITCCGEDVDVVLDTTRAAAAVDVSSPVQN
jgi:hypothetical protein